MLVWLGQAASPSTAASSAGKRISLRRESMCVSSRSLLVHFVPTGNNGESFDATFDCPRGAGGCLFFRAAAPRAGAKDGRHAPGRPHGPEHPPPRARDDGRHPREGREG